MNFMITILQLSYVLYVSTSASGSRRASMGAASSSGSSMSSRSSASMSAASMGGMMSSGMGASSGGSGGSSSSSGNLSESQNTGNTLQQDLLIKTAIDQNTAKAMGKEIPKDDKGALGTIDPLCDPKGVEGEVAQAAAAKKRECYEQLQKKKDLANQIAKQAIKGGEGGNECKVKVSKSSLLCHTRRVLNNLVSKPVYKISNYGNVVELLVDNQTLLYAIVENLSYEITKKSLAKKSALNDPKASFEFNELGGLLNQTGELPVSKTEDPCAVCLEKLNKKAKTMEGSPDECDTNCESRVLTDFAQQKHFRLATPKPAEEGGGGADKKPAGGEDEGAAGGAGDEEAEALK